MFRNVMKVRVKRIGEVYYPEYKGLFLWNTFQKSIGYETFTTNVHFDSLEEASKYVCARQEEYYFPSCKNRS